MAKFDRRYSLIGRPIMALSDSDDPELVIAPAVIERALRHNLAGAYAGTLQNEFWISKAMRTYSSKRGAQVGLEFNDKLADAVRSLGLDTWASRPLSWCLNEKATDALKELGDIDVLVVSKNRGVVWVIEAKDLKLCRTRGEAARRLSGYRGQMTTHGKPDDLLKHFKRVDYLRTNRQALCGRLRLPSAPKVCGVVIVRSPQPMEQLQSARADGRVVMFDDLEKMPWSQGW